MLVLSPGPGIGHPNVLNKAALPLIHHRSDEFKTIYNSIIAQIKMVIQGSHSEIVIMNGSGSTGMESTFMNLINPFDRVLIIDTGYFSKRFSQMAKMYHLNVLELSYAFNERYRIKDVSQMLKKHPDIKAIFMTHSESNSGTLQLIAPIARLCKKCDTLLIVDGVGGAIMNPLHFDRDGIDAYIMASQKGFMMSSGLVMVALSQKAMRKSISNIDRSYSFSYARMIQKFYDDARINTTPAISLYRSLHESLCMINQNSIEDCNRYYHELTIYTRKCLKQLGFMICNRKYFSNSIIVFAHNKLKASYIQKCLEEEDIRIELGLSDQNDRILRIGCMNAITKENMDHFLRVLESIV